jgi:hypothetical protein
LSDLFCKMLPISLRKSQNSFLDSSLIFIVGSDAMLPWVMQETYQNLVKGEIERKEIFFSVKIPAGLEGLNELITSDQSLFVIGQGWVVFLEQKEKFGIVSLSSLLSHI